MRDHEVRARYLGRPSVAGDFVLCRFQLPTGRLATASSRSVRCLPLTAWALREASAASGWRSNVWGHGRERATRALGPLHRGTRHVLVQRSRISSLQWPESAHLAPSVSRKASSDRTNGEWTISCPSPERPGLLPSLRMEVAMRRFSQQLLQWVFMFGLLALVLTCFVLAGCATMAAGSSCGG